MTIFDVPIPVILPPSALIQRARSITSGSRAAFSILVWPSASVAAIIKFSVAPTEAIGILILAPFKRPSTFALI